MSDLQTAMAAIKARFLKRTIDEFALLSAHQAGQHLEPDQLHLIVHRMAGAAGMFGLTDLGSAASEVDTQLADTGKAPALPHLLATIEATLRND